MKPARRLLIYGLLLGVWLLVTGWQVEEHVRIKEAARNDLRNRSREIANTLSAVIRAMRFRDAVLQDRLEPVLNELVSERTNDLVRSSELLSIALLNTAGDPVVSAGSPVNLQQKNLLQEGEHWGANSVTFVTAIAGVNVSPEGETNATVVLPSFRSLTNTFTNAPHGDWRDFRDRDRHPEDFRGSNAFMVTTDAAGHLITNEIPPGDHSNHFVFVERGSGPPGSPPPSPPDRFDRRRPFWLRWMSEIEFDSLVKKRELHGLVVSMSTKNYQATCVYDFWLRCVVSLFAGISVIGVGLAWRNVSKTSDLQIRLVRASELNSHLKEMNLAAAGLAHETRNPLNIIRGMAQMISKQADAPAEIREKSRSIVDQTDKVTAQLNEFINYSRPREVRRSPIALNSAISEVVRTLGHDLEEKKIHLGVSGEPMTIEADEQLFRQALFNLVLNAIQAVPESGRIQIASRKLNTTEACLEVRDDGPGVPPERRQEIFKPYFTTNQKGTGLGLAVVQQIVLVHGWEIECLANEPKGALFRIAHFKVVA